MTKRIFSYNTAFFRKKLLLRTGIVISMFFLFLAYNTFQLPASERGKFLLIFSPLFLLLIWFLQKNYLKQLEILTKGRIEIEGGTLKQFDAYGSCAAVRLKDIVKISHDKFRSYDRLVIETEEKIYPMVNVLEFDELKTVIESSSGKKAEVDTKEFQYLSLRTFFFFLPTILFVGALYSPVIAQKFSFLNPETAYLFFNVNLIVFFLYLPEKNNYILTGFSLKRRMLFISTMVFFFQVYTNLSKAGFFEK
ncbi:hypothetical protein EHQ58_11070 [Leptospira ognonensis]|uniref:Uncharacterized protein n=1 Tax=Leptospira ognonensis TaxID=2484945 RepID=A0A4R9K180_9LEPT|nr:hypothetical protein [Leptospira ognonensis]TGL57936.1 hypothetical protein EHQ58_11070 [Leptospira ognonensis]